MKESIFIYWRQNLVGARETYMLNILVTITGGGLFSFKIIPSPYLLLVFGVVSPIVFTVCTYESVKELNKSAMGVDFSKFFTNRYSTYIAMSIDIFIILLFALLIYTNMLNYFFFRFLQTVFFPIISLSILRFLHVAAATK